MVSIPVLLINGVELSQKKTIPIIKFFFGATRGHNLSIETQLLVLCEAFLRYIYYSFCVVIQMIVLQ